MKTKKRIVFLSGTRADFGKLRPLIDRIDNSDMFECFIFVTGMHTLSKFGSTYLEIQKRGYKNVFVFMNQTHTIDSDIIIANTITGFSNFVKEMKPDMIIIHGDRLETLAGAITGSFNNILVAHVEGGELSGTIDELIRHAVTKLSHIHFVANKEAKQRLIQMGEEIENIFVIGSPDIDVMKSDKLPSIQEVKDHYEIPFDDYAIFIFHSVTTETDSLEENIKKLVSTLIESNKNYVVILPNNDDGSDIIIREYERLRNNNRFRIFPSLRFEYFLTLLKNAKFIIGNSSAGIREAEVYGVPSINVGTRQKNRTKSQHIINVDVKKDEILKAILIAQTMKVEKRNHFGDGKSTERFFQTITSEKIWNTLVQKHFVDM